MEDAGHSLVVVLTLACCYTKETGRDTTRGQYATAHTSRGRSENMVQVVPTSDSWSLAET